MKRIKGFILRDSLILLYRTLVEPYFRYCNTTWGNCGTSLLHKLQTLQNRAAQVITGEADHSSMLKDLNILNVSQLIKLDAVSIIYRTENGLVPDPVPDKVKTWFTKCSSVHSYNTRAAAEGNLVLPRMRTEKGKQAFIESGAKLWNEIPDSVKRSQSI